MLTTRIIAPVMVSRTASDYSVRVACTQFVVASVSHCHLACSEIFPCKVCSLSHGPALQPSQNVGNSIARLLIIAAISDHCRSWSHYETVQVTGGQVKAHFTARLMNPTHTRPVQIAWSVGVVILWSGSLVILTRRLFLDCNAVLPWLEFT